ncbi:SusD-like starch-binding protein associating with outer membrane [Ancylomarina subtilis]|uniref:SusD-like starch-binding protein associating with outer membrane n=1 Tax=Ancylomarina subtilis TaxID=1639035 RepID=A0A4V2FST0_9BACT|nr:RagB/SusD family nutrient uptake outer membrane protein [Ancylomarina subtilis]RZT95485.1 SusD-like starch-binding protein associating with outer membrane [Ancylomarina subtilis]
MRKIYKYFAVSLFALGLSSCELDMVPYETIEKDDVYSSENAIEALTLGNYAILKGSGIADGQSWVNNYFRFGEYSGDNVALSGSTTDPLFYIYNFKRQAKGDRKQSVWTAAYKAIVGCNIVIDRAVEGESAEMDNVIGQNYYLRGMQYFYLTTLFGRPYNQSPETNLGVPIKLSTDVNDQPLRSTVKECYEQVIADLKKAESLMQSEKSASYATKEAAQALLSRVYLYMGDNDNAIAYSDLVINSGRYSLLSKDDLRVYPTFTPDENPETIFALRFVDGADNSGEWDDWYAFSGMYAAVDAEGKASLDGSGWGELYASVTYRDIVEEWPDDARSAFVTSMVLDKNSEDLWGVWYGLNSYKDSDSDEQKKLNGLLFHQDSVSADRTVLYQKLASDQGTKNMEVPITTVVDAKTGVTNYSVIPYQINKETGATQLLSAPVKLRINQKLATRQTYPKYFITKCSGQENKGHLWSPIISRLAEIYLNRAEAYAKKGDIGNALADVNIVRTRAIGPEAAYTPADVTAEMSLLDLVLKERRLELAYEGHRKFDVFRNNRNLDRAYPGTHLRGNDPFFEVRYDSNEIIEYIPEGEILAQPDLQQNL